MLGQTCEGSGGRGKKGGRWKEEGEGKARVREGRAGALQDTGADKKKSLPARLPPVGRMQLLVASAVTAGAAGAFMHLGQQALKPLATQGSPMLIQSHVCYAIRPSLLAHAQLCQGYKQYAKEKLATRP